MLTFPPLPFAGAVTASEEPRQPSHLQALAARGSVRQYRRGVVLIQEGDAGNTMFLIRSGRLRSYASSPDGKEITLGIHRAGEYVGEMTLDGGPRSANVETLEASTCVVLTRETLIGYIAAHPAFALEMMAGLIRRARLATESARDLALMDVYARMTRLLDQLAAPAAPDGTRTIAERLTHQQLASHLACSREMVTRLLKGLETGGYVEIQGRRLVVLKALPGRW